MKIRLSQAAAEALQPREGTYIAYDADLAPFGCRVTPRGVRSWIYEYRPGGGRRSATRRITLGRIDALPCHKARAAAEKLHHQTRLGADPAVERQRQREAPTVDEIADRFLSEEIEPNRKPSTAALYRRYLGDYIRPALGTKRARDVSYSDVTKLHRALGTRGAGVTANRVVALIGTLFRWAGKAGEIAKDHNPASGISRFRERARERYMSAGELARLGDALREAETIGLAWTVDETRPTAKHAPKPENRREILSPYVTAAIRLLILTGCRRSEILRARWEHVDWDRGQLVLPDSKTGGRPVPLSAAALAVLNDLPRLGSYIIAGDSAGMKDEQPRQDLKRPWRAIAKRAGLEGLRLDDLRHSFASLGAGLGLPIVGRLLGHTVPSTTTTYAHLDADPLRRATHSI